MSEKILWAITVVVMKNMSVPRHFLSLGFGGKL
jgi:hypothetical protein